MGKKRRKSNPGALYKHYSLYSSGEQRIIVFKGRKAGSSFYLKVLQSAYEKMGIIGEQKRK